MTDVGTSDPAPHVRLCDFLTSHQGEIIAMWTARIRHMSPAREVSALSLVDHLPDILRRLADILRAVETGKSATLAGAPQAHAVDRLARGFDLSEVVDEYAILRWCIVDAWQRGSGAPLDSEQAKSLNLAIDDAIRQATVRFASAREHMLHAIDGISEAAFGTHELDLFLRRLLEATIESTESVHSAVVFLREDGVLRVRAAVGLERELDPSFSVRVGEGVAGTIAASREPLALRHAAADPRVVNPLLRARGARALYGVPLLHGGDVVGTAHICSLTAFEFSDEDKRLFRTMCSRAAGFIVQAHLRQEAERAARALAEREQAARTAEARLRLAVEATELGTWEWTIATGEVESSPQLARIFGLRDEHGSFARYGRACLYPDDAPAVDAAMARAQDPVGDGRVALEYRIRRHGDGELRWVSTRARTAFDDERRPVRMIGTTVDVTERKRAEMSARFLSEATAVLASSLDYRNSLEQVCRLAVPDFADWAAITLSGNGGFDEVAVAHVDPAKVALVRELSRRHPDAPVGVPAVIRSGKPELAREISDELLAKATRDAEHLRIVRALGLRSYLVVPLLVRGRVLGALTLATAESGRRFDEFDLETARHLGRRAALAVDNARLYQQAREATRLREEVLAVVSHDLKNPLGAVQLSARALGGKLGGADPRLRRHLDIIERSAGRMEHLIADLLDVASIQAGRLAIERREEPVGPLVDEALAIHAPLAADKGVTLRSEASPSGAIVHADHERMLQVLGNLLGNAIKFGGAGAQVVVRAERRAGEVLFSVADTGPGIPADELSHIFEPYWSAARHAKKGTGLGLYISRGIVEAHGGRIWAESTVGVGSAFHFTVPLAPRGG